MDDELARADLIFVLGGEVTVRPRMAAAPYRQGLAPRIVLPRVRDPPGELLGIDETDAAVRILSRLGVPDSAIVVVRTPGGVTSTTAEGRALRAYLRRHPASRVLVVTCGASSRNPRGAPHGGAEARSFNEGNWWRTEERLLRVLEECLKFAHSWVYR